MRNRLKKAGDRGVALVEFAIVLPMFLVLAMGMIDFGLGINAQLEITNASREAARVATIGWSSGQVETLIRELTPNLNQANLTVLVTCSAPVVSPPPDSCTGSGPGGAVSGDKVQVHVTYGYSMITPIPNLIAVDGLWNLSSDTTMRFE